MISSEFSPARSPTIYSSPIASPTWSDDDHHDDGEQFSTDQTDALSFKSAKMSFKFDGDAKSPGSDVGGRDVVLIRNGKKSYGRGKQKKEILKCINMTVKEGAIYGLLGASGCGKTTLLSCIVGLKNMDKKDGSHFLIFGGSPGDPNVGIPGKRVGYMPQEYALFGEFTVRETLQYFGRIYGMTASEISAQSKFLIKLLDLPSDKSRQIRSFSGGQQRRVSFAASLLHTPDLLILDEPTVGVDPMLRQSIWKYLTSLSTGEKKTTIMITTHYIEEARQASAVGLMRNGRLLAEDSPNKLLKQYGVSSLEDVFLKLCLSDNETRVAQTAGNGEMEKEKKKKKIFFQKKGSTYSKNIESSVVSSGLPLSIPKKLKSPNVEIGDTENLEKLSKEEKADLKKNTADFKKTVSDTWIPKASDNSSNWSSIFSLGRLWALMMKNFIKMRRNISMLLFIFLLPAVQVVFFCLAIGRDPTDLGIAVVNEEAPYNNLSLILNHDPHINLSTNAIDVGNVSLHHDKILSSAMLWPQKTINKTYFSTHCPYSDQCEFTYLSCRFLYQLTNLTQGNLISLQTYSLRDSALQAVKEGKVWGLMSIHSNFSRALLDRMFNPLEADATTRNQSKIKVELDMTNQQVNYVIYRSLMEAYDKFVEGLLVSCNFDKESAKMPLFIGDPIYGTVVPNFTEFMAPGIIILINFFLAVALTGEAFIAEKRDGLLDRSRVAGVLSPEILLAAVLTQFLVLVGQTLITLVFILGVFAIPCHGPLGLVIALTLMQGFAGMCFGFLLSILCPSEPAAMQATIGSFYPILLLSGILWPVEGMPFYFQAISWYLPCTCACQAMRDIMSRGWGSVDHMSVKLGFLSSAAWISIFLILSVVFIKIQQKIS